MGHPTDIDEAALANFISGLTADQQASVAEAYRRNPKANPICWRVRGDGRGPERVVEFWLNPEFV